MSAGARAFVLLNFIVLGISFVATTVILIYEFETAGTDSSALATYYSHLFIFFPTFGILALIALYVPATILVDMYWTYVPYGKIRFSIGYVVAVLLSLVIGNVIAGGTDGLKSLFELKPQVLAADSGDPAGCNGGTKACQRAPILTALESVRAQSTQRAGMSKFVRECSPDPLIDDHPQRDSRRFCFVTQSKVDADTCCRAQKRFAERVAALYVPEDNRSLTGIAHRYLLPLKVFFLLMVFAIAGLLAMRHRTLEENYSSYLKKLQRGVLVGACAMILWPLMNLAFLQSSGLLYGTGYESVYRDVSPAILVAYGLWGLLLVFYFFKSYDRADPDMENMGRMASLLGSVVLAFNYQTIIDYAVRFAGSGATIWTLGGLFAILVIAFAFVVMQPKRQPIIIRK